MFGGPAWSPLPDGDWYLHLFAPEQPDLNWAHPVVQADFADTLRFWLARGVDGFRVDVAGGLAKDPAYGEVRRGVAHPHWDRDEVHDVYRSWRRVLGHRARRRGGVGTARAHRGVRPGRRAGPGVRVRRPAHALVRGGPAADRRRPAGGAPRRRRPARVGGRQPRHRPRRDPARTGACAGPAPVPARPARRVLPVRRRRAGPARRRRAPRALAGPAVAAVRRRAAQPRRRPRAAAVDVRTRRRLHDGHAVAADPRDLGRSTPGTAQEADPTSTWSVLHRALAARSGPVDVRGPDLAGRPPRRPRRPPRRRARRAQRIVAAVAAPGGDVRGRPQPRRATTRCSSTPSECVWLSDGPVPFRG